MPYKAEHEIHNLLQQKELIAASESFIHKLGVPSRLKELLSSDFGGQEILRGLRYPNGTGVVAGATSIGDVDGYELVDGKKIPREGRLFYRGIDVRFDSELHGRKSLWVRRNSIFADI